MEIAGEQAGQQHDDHFVGTPPWQGTWPTGDHYSPELLEKGDHRNVADEFRYWREDAIRRELDKRLTGQPHLWIAIENWHHDFNIGSVVRTANAFNVAGVFIVGNKRWNRRGAMVTDRYLHIQHCDDARQLLAEVMQLGTTPLFPIIGVDNIPGSVPLESYRLPRNCLLVFGQESTGLTPEMQAVCEAIVHITQYGSTRSINAGAAAAIAMFAWSQQHRLS